MGVNHNRIARQVASALLIAALAGVVASCKTIQGTDTTGSLASTVPRSEEDWRKQAEFWAPRYQSHPHDPGIAISYAQALRMSDQRSQAAAVLQRTSMEHPFDRAVLGAYGRALADIGNYQQALEVLGRAHTPDQPDWRILSAQGAVLDQMGRHTDAQRYYASALRIEPNDPTILSNLGLSYALSRDLVRAEETLRRAAAQQSVDPRVRQNLALVVGLQGRFAEAETIARADLPEEEAAANVTYLRQMLAQQQELNRPGAPAKPVARQAKAPKPKRLGPTVIHAAGN